MKQSLRQKIKELNHKFKQQTLLLDEKIKIILLQKENIKIFEREIKSLEEQNEKLKNELNHKSQIHDEKIKKKSKNIAGWTALKCTDGYYRAHKTINGKSYGTYIGKRITKATKSKLQKKEKEIRSVLIAD